MRHLAVIFDLRGTLLVEPPPQFTLNATMLQANSLQVDPIRFASCWFEHAHQTPRHIELPWIESNLQAVCDDLGIRLDPLLRRRLAEQRERVIRQTLKPRRAAVRTLTRIRAAGLRTAVVGDVPPDVRVMLQQTDIARHLDVELLSTSGTCKHDDPRIMRRTLKELGLPGDACLYVSTGGFDELDAADYLGMHPVAFRPPDDEDEDDDATASPTTFGGYPAVSTMIEVYWMATESAAVV
jgi:FMN phosphatase YigB (HAD superfamily)